MEHKIYGRTLRLNLVMASKSVCGAVSEQNVMTTPTNKGENVFLRLVILWNAYFSEYIEEKEDSQTGLQDKFNKMVKILNPKFNVYIALCVIHAGTASYACIIERQGSKKFGHSQASHNPIWVQ